eukprot:GEMP01021591.1.p1 GENE.GEMP01021591.1~~GEMP01021591.1.p1  ORF type:complete len:703 (+),score=196.11 GEMP01021591.1:55-2109(+)
MESDDIPSWKDFGQRHFDPRITKALTKTLNLQRPTFVQYKAIPVCLRGQDVMCKAVTGSGKTLAYLVPLVHRILTDPGSMRGLIIVPTKELSVQVHQVCSSLLAFCFDVLTVDYLLPGQKYMKAELPSILVASPSSVVALMNDRNIKLSSLRMLVVDEADLLFSFGYEEDMRNLARELPQTYQAMLCSATLSTEVEELKGLVLHKPTTLDLGKDLAKGKLTQFYFPCKNEEKYLVLYALLKLRLLQGKTLVFVADVTRGYEMKLFLERFAINCSLLNSELSWEARQGVIQAFNQNIVDLCIATDEGVEEDEDHLDSDDDENDGDNEEQKTESSDKKVEDDDFGEEMSDMSGGEESQEELPSEDEEEEDEEEEDEDEGAVDADVAEAAAEIKLATEQNEKKERKAKKAEEKMNKKKKGRGKKNRDKHFSMTRGLDFIDVDNVLNVDLPQTYRSYVHRVGRTARAGKTGTALSLVTQDDAEVLQKITEHSEITALPLRLEDVERLRYRVEDVRKSVTPKEVKAVRVRELQQEAMNSQKLAAYFEDNPDDLKALQKNLRRFKERKTVRKHLKYLPSYLIPESVTAKTPVQVAVSDQVGSYGGRSKRRGRVDPLSFEAKSSKKRKFSRLGQEEKATRQRNDANVEELVPLSGRKIWKLNHRKRLKRKDMQLCGGRSARSVRKTAKKFT